MSEFDEDQPTPPERPPLTLEDSQSRRRGAAITNRLLERDMPPEQQRLAYRMRVHRMDPYDLIAAISDMVATLQDQADTGERERSAASEALLAVPKQMVAMDGRVKALEGDAKFAKRAAQGVIVFVLVSSFGAAWWLWGRGEAAGVDKQRLQQVEDAQRRQERQIDRLEGQRWPQAMKDTSP